MALFPPVEAVTDMSLPAVPLTCQPAAVVTVVMVADGRVSVRAAGRGGARRHLLVQPRGRAIAIRGVELDEPLIATQEIERPVLRHLDQPRRRIRGDALVRPELQRLDQRVLRGFLGQRQVPRAEDPCERGHDLREDALEVEIVDHGRVTSTSRTSMLP